MTTNVNPFVSPLQRWTRRLAFGWRNLFAPGDEFALIVAALLLLMPLLALAAAGWPAALNTVVPVLLLSTLFGFLLARSQYNELLALLMSGIYGTGFVLLIAAINEPGGLGEGAYSVFSRLLRWIMDAATGGINQDELVFTLLIALLFWFLGYNVVWHVFRIDRVWRAILPPGLILVANSVYYTGDRNLDGYLIAFAFLSLLLIIRSNLDARSWEWYVNGIRVPRSLRRQFFRVGIFLALIAVLAAWLAPRQDLQERLNRFQEFLQSDPLTQFSELWSRLFESVETQGPTTADYYGGDSLQLGGAIQLGQQVVFQVSAPPGRRYYWRSRVFDIYDAGRWAPAASTRLTVEQGPLNIAYDPSFLGARDAVQQQFTVGLNASRLVYAAPQPLRVDLPTRTDLRYAPDDETRSSMNISVIRPTKVLRRGDSYTTTSLMSSATASQLRGAGTGYPEWVTRLYLQMSPSISDRTLQLARAIVNQAGATTPYDQAKALETWLRTNILYNEVIPQPPLNQDPVDWVLFDLRQGYCNYYASAMVMMLRSLGVPARMAAGFAQGEWDAGQNAYVVRERDAHTWVEVFFPGYGWIEFEPTAAQAPLNRVDDVPAGLQPSATPLTSPTPTQTPTPSPTPTSEVPPTPLPPNAQLVPTVTPTFTPSPTPTPVIVPTQPPPLTPQPRGPLALLLSALGLALLVLLLIALVIGLGVFIYWWWEWRGMRGLSPIVRAYARLERYLNLIGIRLNPQQTPEERRRIIVRALPKAEPPVSAITQMYTAERYGAQRAQSPHEAEIQHEVADDAWQDARTTILQRWLRRLLPGGQRRE
ncbi:MAG: transglutaminase domain-containing protein [Chloroflexi bacterium]|nr:transglutaminase domain-containing protein [Chloroflexota bacterium]